VITLISIGLNSHRDLSLKAVEAAQSADMLYAETYTMKLDTTIEELEKTIGKKITSLQRNGLEEQAEDLLQEAKNKHVAILVGGDALSATTHISLILDAYDDQIPTQVIHGSSIFTAISETGLSLYKFGKTVTVPLPEKGPLDSVVQTIKQNLENGLHTLLLLDLDIPKKRYLTIPQAIQLLLETDELKPDSLLIGVARLGSKYQTIKADSAINLQKHEFGKPPYSLIVPGKLHFLEEEALETLAKCPRKVIRRHNPVGETDRLITKYIASCRKVLNNHQKNKLPLSITENQVQQLLNHVKNYLEDAEYYQIDKKPTALTSVAYAEGILDALKLLGLLEFEW
jgi:diphthine synthase